MTTILKDNPNYFTITEEIDRTIILIDQPAVNNFSGASLQRSLTFQYNNASSQVIASISSTSRIVAIKIGIITPWDVASTVTVGDDSDSDRLVQSSQVDLTKSDVFEATPFYKYGSTTSVKLYLNSGVGATQGSAEVILYLDN